MPTPTVPHVRYELPVLDSSNDPTPAMPHVRYELPVQDSSNDPTPAMPHLKYELPLQDNGYDPTPAMPAQGHKPSVTMLDNCNDSCVKDIQDVLVMLAKARRTQDQATRALEHILTTLPDTSKTKRRVVAATVTGTGSLDECAHGSETGESCLESQIKKSISDDTPMVSRHLSSHIASTVKHISSNFRAYLQQHDHKRVLRNLQSARVTHHVHLPGFCNQMAAFLLGRGRLEILMGAVILANSICIGIETQQRLSGKVSPAIEVLEHVFVAIYIAEVIVRLIGNGWASFNNGWFVFDFCLVITGIFITWVLQPIQASSVLTPGSRGGVMSQLMVLRVGRLLRMLRALRLMKRFRSIWKLVYGLLASFNTMMSTLALVALVLYIFACLGVELITKDEVLNNPQYPDLKSIVDRNFKDLFVTFMFLFQFVTQDSLSAVYMPLIKAKPSLALYFVCLLLVVSISLMNLVMATIVEGALDAAHRDNEMRRQQKKEKIKATTPLLRKLFVELDTDSSGQVDLQELVHIDLSTLPEELSCMFQMDSMMELFDILDMEETGAISEDEFVDGMLHLHLSAVPNYMMQVIKMLRKIQAKVESMEKRTSRDMIAS